MLTDDEIMPTIYYWAHRFKTRNIPFDELVNVGYLHCKPLRDRKLINPWAKYKMLDYVIGTRRKMNDRIRDVKCVHRGVTLTESDGVNDAGFDIIDTLLDEVEEIEGVRESIWSAINQVCDADDLALIRLRFWDNMRAEEIGELYGMKRQSVQLRIKNILSRLKKAYEKKI